MWPKSDYSVLSKMTSHWAGTVQMREESEKGDKKVRRDVN